MKALLNGDTKPVYLAKGSDETVRVTLFNDDGSVLDVTGGTLDLVVYDRTDRANAALATHGGETLVTPTGGYATVAIPDTELTYGPGEFAIFARFTNASLKVFYAQAFTLVVR